MGEHTSYDYHLPVFLERSLDYLITKPNGLYVDGTLGGGGHAQAIFEKLDSGGNLLAFDKDPDAIGYCRRKFKNELNKSAPRVELINKCYSEACTLADEKGLIDGILLDLGVSSRQLDTDQRGLSYRVKSPLDMRFSPHGPTAEDLLNAANAGELEGILRRFGEEPLARVIARRLVERRRGSTLKTTFDLRLIIEEVAPKNHVYKTLSRVFQAIRIAVNSELDVLEYTLKNIPQKMNSGGRIVVISYHSLEDRITKNIFKEYSKTSGNKYAKDAEKPKLKLLTPKPVIPTEEEISQNPRARSAKLRVAEKN
jgi:16S rRNA (cytosine1402-N4)-methyltransferase